jgi:archaellum component FlaC
MDAYSTLNGKEKSLKQISELFREFAEELNLFSDSLKKSSTRFRDNIEKTELKDELGTLEQFYIQVADFLRQTQLDK